MENLILKNKRLANEHTTLGASFFNSGALGLAVEQFEMAVTLAPHNATYLRNLGAALLESGMLADAEKALLKSIELDPQNEKAHYHFAQLLTEQGDHKAAARELQLVISIAPKSDLAERARQLVYGWKPKITLGLSGSPDRSDN